MGVFIHSTMKLKERPAMPLTIEQIKGRDLIRLEPMQTKGALDPDRVYSITIYTDEDQREMADTLLNLADQSAREAEASGLTPEKFDQIVGKKVSHTF